MKAWACYLPGAALALLGLLVLPSQIRDAGRLHRLGSEGRTVRAEIVKIEEETIGTDPDTSVVEMGTLRYIVADKAYENRHILPKPMHVLKREDAILVRILPDEPSRSYIANEMPGNWIMAFMTPVLLLLGGATLIGAGRLLRSSAP
jgi:hypothetical protein